MISSKMRSAPWRSASVRRNARNSGSGARTPPAPWTGSMMIAARSSLPAAQGSLDPVGVAPRQLDDRARTSPRGRRASRPSRRRGCRDTSARTWPTSGRPVNARAARMANIVASVPELVKRSRSTDGSRRRISSASSISVSVGAANAEPRRTCASTAATTAPGGHGRGSARCSCRGSRGTRCRRRRGSDEPLARGDIRRVRRRVDGRPGRAHRAARPSRARTARASAACARGSHRAATSPTPPTGSCGRPSVPRRRPSVRCP